jgi:hydrogenase assembly chaperone HypC/HupF
MCIAFPGRVVSVDETGATVDIEGRLRRASTLIEPDVAAGEWVMIVAGTIVERLDEAWAAEIRDTLHEAIDLAAGQTGEPDAVSR